MKWLGRGSYRGVLLRAVRAEPEAQARKARQARSCVLVMLVACWPGFYAARCLPLAWQGGQSGLLHVRTLAQASTLGSGSLVSARLCAPLLTFCLCVHCDDAADAPPIA